MHRKTSTFSLASDGSTGEKQAGFETMADKLLASLRAQHDEITERIDTHFTQQQLLLTQALGKVHLTRTTTRNAQGTDSQDLVAAHVWNRTGDCNDVHEQSGRPQLRTQATFQLPGSIETEPIIPMPSPRPSTAQILPRSSPNDITASRSNNIPSEIAQTKRKKVEQIVAANSRKSLTSRDRLIKQQDQQVTSMQRYLLRVLQSGWFDVCSFALIGAFTLYVILPLGTERDCSSSKDGNLVADTVFCVLFALELLMRVAPYGLAFFRSQDYMWNILDAIIVGVSCAQLILEASTSRTSAINPMFLRMLRLFRAVSTFRMVRVLAMLRELRLLINSVLGCVRSLAFSLLMLSTFIVLCSTFLTVGAQACTLDGTSEQARQISKGFGTLGRSCVTLYMAISGGMDWGENYWVLEPLGWQYQLAYIMYVSFAIFGLVNVFTGIFVDHAMQASTNDREVQIRSQLSEEKHNLKELQRVFQELDCNGSGKLSVEELENHLNDERALAYFQAVKLDVTEVGRLFRLMDMDNSGSIDIEEFIIGCQRLKGESRSLDIKIALLEIENLQRAFERFAEDIETLLASSHFSGAIVLDST